MYNDLHEGRAPSGLRTPVRNSYFYGQLLGVASLELETEYAIAQRRLLNRLVLGYGVICGLDVTVSDDHKRVQVGPGAAIDGWGREIVVPEPTPWTPIGDDLVARALQRARDCKEDACVQVLICYHECRGDPAPVYAGDCDSADPCAPSTLSERYRVVLRDRCAKRREHQCDVKDLVDHGEIDHGALARWVTERRCGDLPRDPCVPLANIGIADGEEPRCDRRSVDIDVRPVLPSNRVLMELILALLDRDRADQSY
jgi:hypothetical protein